MKKIVLVFLLLVGSSYVFGHIYDMGEYFLDFLKDFSVELAEDFVEDNFGNSCEKNQRRDVYYAARGNPHFYKMSDIAGNRDYLISILSNHLQRLEQRIKENKPWYKTGSTLKGLLCSTISLCFYFYLYTKIKIIDISWDLASVDDCIALGLFAVPPIVSSIISIYYFNNALYHTQHLMKQMERDKAILKALENS